MVCLSSMESFHAIFASEFLRASRTFSFQSSDIPCNHHECNHASETCSFVFMFLKHEIVLRYSGQVYFRCLNYCTFYFSKTYLRKYVFALRKYVFWCNDVLACKFMCISTRMSGTCTWDGAHAHVYMCMCPYVSCGSTRFGEAALTCPHERHARKQRVCRTTISCWQDRRKDGEYREGERIGAPTWKIQH